MSDSNYKRRLFADGVRPVAPSPRERNSRFAFFRARLSPWLPPDRQAELLDLGCGQGLFLDFLRAQGYTRLTGVDVSPTQLAAARSQVPGVVLVEADLRDFLAGREAAYDGIIALDVIEHLDKESVLEFLAAAYRTLKPGGRLILQTPNGASPWGMSVRYADFTHDCCFTPVSLGQLLELSGYRDVAFRGTDPVAKNLLGVFRWALWKLIRWGLAFSLLAETGSAAGGIYTRVFLAAASKPQEKGVSVG